MSARKAKAVRKQVKRVMRDDYVSTLFWLKRLPFRQRLGIAWKITRGVRTV